MNRFNAKALNEWLFHQSAGIQISSDPGGGKTNIMEVFQQAIIQKLPGQGLLYIDPDGQSARKMYRFCLDQGASVAARTVYFHPCDTRSTLSFNPAAVRGDDCDPFTLQARRVNKMEHVSNIYLTTAGDEDGFAQKPLLRKWLPRVLTATSAADLTLPDAALFVDTESDFYHEIIRAIGDPLARREFAELPDMRPADREALIGSTKSRLLMAREHPQVEAILGRSDHFLDAGEAIKSGTILIANLERGGVLRQTDQEFLANLLLTEFLHAIFNMPEDELRPYFVFVDELPVFKSSASVLTYALARIRKYKLRFIAAHQGANLFPERTQDQLLHSLISMCGVHIYGRHADPVDCKLFGEVVALPGFSPTKAKHTLTQQQQYQDGNDLVVLTDHSEGESEGEETGNSEATGNTLADTWSSDVSSASGSNRVTTTTESSSKDQLLRETVGKARADAAGTTDSTTRRDGQGGSAATTHTNTRTSSRSTSRNRSVTRKQQLVPRLKWREVVTSVQFLTPEEQTLLAAGKIAGFQAGRAVVHMSGSGSAVVQFPLSRTAFRRAPKTAGRKELWHYYEQLKRPDFAKPKAILAQRRRVLEALLSRLRELPSAAEVLPPIGGSLTFPAKSKRHTPAAPRAADEPSPTVEQPSTPLTI